MTRPLLVLPPLIFAGLALLFYVGISSRDTGLPSVFIGQPAPPVSALALPGVPMLTPDLLQADGIKIVNFWASWCPPCRAEHPVLMDLAASGLPVYGVNMMDREADALAFLSEAGNPYAAIAADPKGAVRLDWGVTAPPETFIIGPGGTVQFKFIGPLIGSDAEQRFFPALEAALAQDD